MFQPHEKHFTKKTNPPPTNTHSLYFCPYGNATSWSDSPHYCVLRHPLPDLCRAFVVGHILRLLWWRCSVRAVIKAWHFITFHVNWEASTSHLCPLSKHWGLCQRAEPVWGPLWSISICSFLQHSNKWWSSIIIIIRNSLKGLDWILQFCWRILKNKKNGSDDNYYLQNTSAWKLMNAKPSLDSRGTL